MVDSQTLDTKIIDFGSIRDYKKLGNLTTYICTRWYRAPECVLNSLNYGPESDIFAVGCIMAELFKASPLFPGQSEMDQIHQIFKVLGSKNLDKKWP